LIWTHRFSALEFGMLAILAAFVLFAGVKLVRAGLRGQPITFSEWGFFAFLSVALLPILWSFAILPLLPFLVEAVSRKNLSSLLAGAALVLAIPFPPFGGEVRYWLLPMLLLSGVALSLNAIRAAKPQGGATAGALPEATSPAQG